MNKQKLIEPGLTALVWGPPVELNFCTPELFLDGVKFGGGPIFKLLPIGGAPWDPGKEKFPPGLGVGPGVGNPGTRFPSGGGLNLESSE